MKFPFLFLFFIATVCHGQVSIGSNDQQFEKRVIVARTDFLKEAPTLLQVINDFSNKLNQEEIARLDSISRAIWKDSKLGIYIVILDSVRIPRAEYEEFSDFLFEYSVTVDRANSILFIISPQFRLINVEAGVQVKPAITFKEEELIINSIAQHLSKDKYFDGLKAGLITAYELYQKHGAGANSTKRD